MRLVKSIAMAAALASFAAWAARAETAEDLAKNPNLFLSVATKAMGWEVPFEPLKIAGPIYFVGTQGLSTWLITTPDGHFLLNTGMPSSGPMIVSAIKKLGFDPMDIKYILTCHAHIDHVGGHAYLKKLTGAKVVMIAEEAPLIASGGKTDFFYGNASSFQYTPVEPDQIISDGQSLRLGDVTLTAHLTPGHSKGATTWTTEITDNDHTYRVVFVDGLGINPGYRVSVQPSYPGIERDYRHTMDVLDALTPDIWLTAHTDVFGFKDKSARAATEGAKAWVDPAGYRKYLADQRKKFEDTLEAESANK